MQQPKTQFTTVGVDRVAYQVMGEGPRDLLFAFGRQHHLDMMWDEPAMARFLARLASFARLIRFDRRGAGLSDPVTADGCSNAAHWTQDCLAVLDAVHSVAPVILNGTTFDAGQLILNFVDHHPERCSGLILVNATACLFSRPGYPEGWTVEGWESVKEFIMRTWGQPEVSARYLPSQAKNPATMQWYAKLARSMATPRALVEYLNSFYDVDVRAALPRIGVPTLVMGRHHYEFVPKAQSQYIAEHIPGARFVELPGGDAFLAWESPELSLGLIEEFVTGRRRGGEAERAITAILFTDIVESTRHAAELGDAAWHALLERHDRIVREQIDIHHGRLVEVTGDGTLVCFESPRSAVHYALSLRAALAEHELEIRAGLHFAEVELRSDGRIGGIAVHIGSRVMALAGAGELLVSRSVRDVLLGAHIEFQERGDHVLKGVPDRWQVYAVSEPV